MSRRVWSSSSFTSRTAMRHLRLRIEVAIRRVMGVTKMRGLSGNRNVVKVARSTKPTTERSTLRRFVYMMNSMSYHHPHDCGTTAVEDVYLLL